MFVGSLFFFFFTIEKIARDRCLWTARETTALRRKPTLHGRQNVLGHRVCGFIQIDDGVGSAKALKSARQDVIVILNGNRAGGALHSRAKTTVKTRPLRTP